MRSQEELDIQQRRNQKFIDQSDIRNIPDEDLKDYQIAEKKAMFRQTILVLQKYIPFEREYHLYKYFNQAVQYYGFDAVGEILSENSS